MVTKATRIKIFGFIRSKTTAYFRKGTWKLSENIKCVGGKILDIKTLLKSTAKKVSQDYDECSLPQRDAWVSYSSFYFLVARLLMSFHKLRPVATSP